MEAWLASSTRLLGMLPEDLLVLPAHQSPFTGVRVRLNQIIDSHRLALANLYDLLIEPKLLPECFGCYSKAVLCCLDEDLSMIGFPTELF